MKLDAAARHSLPAVNLASLLRGKTATPAEVLAAALAVAIRAAKEHGAG